MNKKIIGIFVCTVFFGACVIPSISISNESFTDDFPDQAQTVCDGSVYGGVIDSAQSFRPTLNTLTKVKLMIGRFGNPSGNLHVSIRSSLNGSDLTSSSIPASSVPILAGLCGVWTEFDFMDISVIPEQKYFIVYWGEPTWDGSNHILNSDGDYNPYPRGEFWSNFGGTWHITDYGCNGDLTFITYGCTQGVNLPPSVSIGYPNNGSTVYGLIEISGSSREPNCGDIVESVEVRIDDDGWEIADGTTTWGYFWDTTMVDDGEHMVSARCFDGEVYSDVVLNNVIVDNAGVNIPPTIIIAYPDVNDTVSGVVTVRGLAHDSDGAVEFVEVKVDNMSWAVADGNASWSYDFDTSSVSNGIHSIFARCYDGYHYSEERFVNVSVVNLVEIAIDSILGGFRVSTDIMNIGTVTVTDVEWSIGLEGGLILMGGSSSGIIPTLEAGESVNLRLDSLFGILPTTITVTAGDASKQATAFILGPLVLGVQEI